MHNTIDIIVLFSGGLDSILAAKVLADQGLRVQCLHMVSPFFGDSSRIPYWEDTYSLSISAMDIGDSFVRMLYSGPKYGFGKTLNPCVDCKILLLQKAKEFMLAHGAKAIATGEVVGQRPMSQRRDMLNAIAREADVKDVLVRPLCALHLPETKVEETKIVIREKLLGISGRGRKEQLKLAEHFGLSAIPTPAGGCKLTEKENVRRYWNVLNYEKEPLCENFILANCGRQFWYFRDDVPYWLLVGRNKEDNERLEHCACCDDLLLTFPQIAAPVAVARHGVLWDTSMIESAGALSLSYAVRAIEENNVQRMHVLGREISYEMDVEALRSKLWQLPEYRDIAEALSLEHKKRVQHLSVSHHHRTF